MRDTEFTPDGPEPEEPPIIVVGFDKSSYYLYKGEEFLNQLLLTDGEYPKPILCVHFETVFEARRVIGPSFTLADCWGIHPEIIARLRDTKTLVETEA